MGSGPASPGQTLSFGPFRLRPSQQLLLEGDDRAALGSRALDILIALVQRAGEIVSKEDLIAQVWPDVFVEDSNLRVHITSLRRALHDGQSGSRYVVTIPGRGYSFVAPVSVTDADVVQDPVPPEQQSYLPFSLTRIIGRDDIVATLSAQMAQRRMMTLVGPGGIGKTTVAAAVARKLMPAYRDGVSFVDLASISHPDRLPGALAVGLGLAMQSEITLAAIVVRLKDKQILLVLDSCEHVVEAAAAAAEDICRGALGVHILATSREPLRAAGERVHRLAPLESPSASAGLTAAEALTFPGIQLFVERAAASLEHFELTDADTPFVADICRRLDGIALAIELAAGRVAAFGVRELAARLDDRFQLLTSGRRTALPRHQTLAATLEWSIQLLPEADRTLLRRLAIFPGDFSLQAAVAQAPELHASDVAGHVADLVAKSLVVADLRDDVVHYRLLDTTRLYGLETLKANGELPQALQRHAAYFADFFAPADAECESRSKADWLARYGWQIDNVRAALDWAFSDAGDAALGVALTIVAVPLWVQLSLMAECRVRVETALARLDRDQAAAGLIDDAAADGSAGGDGSARGDGSAGGRQRMQLCAALGWSLTFATGRAVEAGAMWTETLRIAVRLADTSYQLRALWGLWVAHLNAGAFRKALELANRFVTIVTGSSDTIDLMMADRMLATTLHFIGEQQHARRHIEQMLSRYAAFAQQPQVARFQFDQRVTARYFQARILWLQGYADHAMRVVASNIEEAQAFGHALSFGSVLGQGACPIALFSGDLVAAARYGSMLLDHAERHGLRLWRAWAQCFNGLVMVRQGHLDAGLQILRTELDQAGHGKFLPRYLFLLGEFAASLAEAGDVSLGLETINQALVRCERNEERWYIAELIRIKGELMLLSGVTDAAAAAEQAFLCAIRWADRQDARAWALRSSVSLARLWRDTGQAGRAHALLSTVQGGFSEGFGTDDWRSADRLLTELA